MTNPKSRSVLRGKSKSLGGHTNWEPTLDHKGRINEKMLHQLGLYNAIKYRKTGVAATAV